MSIANLVSVCNKDTDMMDELIEVPDKLKDVFLLEDQISRVAKSLTKIQTCFVLARGLNYPIALESSLKIQETCYVEAKVLRSQIFTTVH